MLGSLFWNLALVRPPDLNSGCREQGLVNQPLGSSCCKILAHCEVSGIPAGWAKNRGGAIGKASGRLLGEPLRAGHIKLLALAMHRSAFGLLITSF